MVVSEYSPAQPLGLPPQLVVETLPAGGDASSNAEADGAVAGTGLPGALSSAIMGAEAPSLITYKLQPVAQTLGVAEDADCVLRRNRSEPPRTFLPMVEQQLTINRSMTVPVAFKSQRKFVGVPPFLQRSDSASRSLLQALSRTLSGSIPQRVLVKTMRCTVCLENVSVAEIIVPENCGREAHAVCQDCLTMHLTIRITEGRVSDLHCPSRGADGCNATVTNAEMERLLDGDMMQKLRRFERMTADPQLRACPQCNELSSPQLRNPEDPSSGVIPEMECGACSSGFCFYHSNAHAPGSESCAEYERQIVMDEKKAHAAVGSKKCPRCGVATEKSSGCNHMTCKCKCEWCWVCAKEITNVGWHYNPLRPLSCAQFNSKDEQRDHARLTSVAFLSKLFCWPASLITVVFVVLYIVVFMAFQVALLAACCVCNCASCCCCFCYSASKCENSEEEVMKCWLLTFSVLTGLVMIFPFLAFWLAWAILAVPLWLSLVPCGATGNVFFEMVSVPPITVMTTLEMFS